MTRLILVLLFGLVCEAFGVVLLARGQRQLPPLGGASGAEILRLAQAALTNGPLLLGVALEAVFFGCLLFLLSRADVSFVWPLSGLSFAFTTLAARFLLHEDVQPLRWFGVALIVAGAGFSPVSVGRRRNRRPRTRGATGRRRTAGGWPSQSTARIQRRVSAASPVSRWR